MQAWSVDERHVCETEYKKLDCNIRSLAYDGAYSFGRLPYLGRKTHEGTKTQSSIMECGKTVRIRRGCAAVTGMPTPRVPRSPLRKAAHRGTSGKPEDRCPGWPTRMRLAQRHIGLTHGGGFPSWHLRYAVWQPDFFVSGHGSAGTYAFDCRCVFHGFLVNRHKPARLPGCCTRLHGSPNDLNDHMLDA